MAVLIRRPPILSIPKPSGGGGGPATPTIIQHVASSANPLGIAPSGNNFKLPIPNPSGSGNCTYLAISYPHGSTPTITDNNGNTWPAAAASADAGVGNNVLAVYILPNTNSGLTTITVGFGGAIVPFSYTLGEINNIATSSPVNGTSTAAGVTGPSLSTGSFTPGNNDANGGNLILNFYALAATASGNPSVWTSGGSFTLLDGDIAWNTNQGFPHASQYFIQTTSAAINSSITAAAGTGSANSYNCVAVALKVASAGTPKPAGIHIDKIIHQTSNVPPTTTWTLQFPTMGNLRVLTMNANGVINVTSITDSEGNLDWTKIEPSLDEPQIWYSPNKTANPNLTVTLHISGTPATTSVRCRDISGAAASPFDVSAGLPNTGVNNVTTISDAPVITPTTANGLVIAAMGFGQGPGLSVTSPTGAVWDLCTYAGEPDTDLMENADADAHFYNAGTATQHWNWTFTAVANNSASATAAAFKAA